MGKVFRKKGGRKALGMGSDRGRMRGKERGAEKRVSETRN